jgi:hypothetical protein
LRRPLQQREQATRKYLFAASTCHFSYAGREVSTNYFDFLYLNIEARTPTTPIFFDFVVGTDTNGEDLLACAGTVAADNDSSVQLGKFRQDFSACHVSWGGDEWEANNTSVVDGISFNRLH